MQLIRHYISQPSSHAFTILNTLRERRVQVFFIGPLLLLSYGRLRLPLGIMIVDETKTRHFSVKFPSIYNNLYTL